MNHPTGFLQYTRVLPGKRPVEDRLQDYREFVGRYSEAELHRQSARCMNCGVAFCHSGCPLGNLIPEFNEAVLHQRWAEAYDILSSTNNFPEFTGRICPAPCESACVLGINQAPVAIEEVEKHIIEIAFAHGLVQPRKPAMRSGKKVAVIGSGPAGLAAAAQLNAAGHQVTVFEKDEAPGGLLRYGIPDFKLEKWVVQRRIDLLAEEGIVFRTQTTVGRDVAVNDVLRSFQAVVLATGATVPRALDIKGSESQGVHYAMDYLTAANRQVAHGTPPAMDARGKHVIVIGGGDTGSDCVGTANRQGAASVTQFAWSQRPHDQRTPYMPWPTYPLLLQTTSSHEEGCERVWAIATKAFLADAEGRLRALQVVELSWEIPADGSKPVKYTEVPGSEREIPCELALIAIGYAHPEHEGLLDQLGVAYDRRGNIRASERDYATSIPKVFAAGDARRGQSLVVWAISEGRECARRVDAFLTGGSLLEARDCNIVAAGCGAGPFPVTVPTPAG